MNTRPHTLISDPQERAERTRAKRQVILTWLRANTWSTADVLRQVTRLESRQAIHTTLNGMARDQLIRKATIECEFGPPLLIWGITPHGAAMAAGPTDTIEARTFEPSKVNPLTVGHTLDLQCLQLRAEAAGWKWRPVSGELFRSQAKYADAVAVRPDGQLVAIEVERTVKSTKRYAEILVGHLAARKEGKWHLIYYLCPEDAIRDRVKRAFAQVTQARWRGQTVKIGDAHRAPFRFFTYGESWTKAG